MNNIELIKQFKSYPTYNRFVGLLAPHRVSPSLVLNAVYAAVMESVGGMIPGAKYSTEELCGDEVWWAWPSVGQRRAMGICLSFLVAQELVPLICSSPAHVSNKRYSLKPSTH